MFKNRNACGNPAKKQSVISGKAFGIKKSYVDDTIKIFYLCLSSCKDHTVNIFLMTVHVSLK